MKTILHLIDSLETGGAEVMLAGIIPSLPEYKHVIVTLIPGNDFEEQLNSIPIYCLDYHSKFDLLNAKKVIRSIIQSDQVDLIHSHLLSATFLARIAKPAFIPLVFSVHNILSQSAFKNSRLSYYMEKFSYKKDHHAIFVSDEVCRDYNNSIGIKGTHTVLYNYIDDHFFEEQFSKKQYLLNEPPRLVCVGTLKKQKNYTFLIEALSEFNRDFTLDIFGTGPEERKLNEMINATGMSESIKLRGYEPSVLNRLSNYDLLLMPSRFEGFGIALVEAMALGIPTLIAGIDTLMSVSKGSSVDFQPGSSADLREKLTLLLDDQELRESKGQSGKIRAAQISLKSNYLKNLNQIYQEYVPEQ